jgi:hypothetical protein
MTHFGVFNSYRYFGVEFYLHFQGLCSQRTLQDSETKDRFTEISDTIEKPTRASYKDFLLLLLVSNWGTGFFAFSGAE